MVWAKIISDVVWDRRSTVLGQDRSETKNSVLVLVLHTVVMVLQVWCCVVKHSLLIKMLRTVIN